MKALTKHGKKIAQLKNIVEYTHKNKFEDLETRPLIQGEINFQDFLDGNNSQNQINPEDSWRKTNKDKISAINSDIVKTTSEVLNVRDIIIIM